MNILRAGFSLLLATSLALPLRFGHAEAAVVTLVVPFARGGPADTLARDFVAAAASHAPDKIFQVENVPGQGGSFGALTVAKAPPGATVLLLQNIAHSVAPSVHAPLPYDTLEDFAYVGMIEAIPMAVLGRPGLPAHVEHLRSAPGLSLAHAGDGSASHLCGLLLQRALGRRFTQRSYDGNAPAMVDLLAGRVDLLCDATNSARSQLGQSLSVYGITSPSRLTAHPLNALPTLAELGLSGTDMSVWFGLVAPRGIDKTELERLNEMLRTVVADRNFVAKQEANGATLASGARLTPDGYKAYVASQIAHWRNHLSTTSPQAAPEGRTPR
ncbi:tripartite tricarboxylate transporter substrate-binding protein [Ideonella sp. DXS29W]|uniref:Tripartite tricarboxylate transporter substrate-binding protein n=1 Tax=Ideonella lacteola TaxID=2984193 RepID=A0ABU9BTA1_9BURK